MVGDYAQVGYAHFNALTCNGYGLDSWYKNVGEEIGTPLPQIIGVHSHFHPEDRALMLTFLSDVIAGNGRIYGMICESDGLTGITRGRW